MIYMTTYILYNKLSHNKCNPLPYSEIAEFELGLFFKYFFSVCPIIYTRLRTDNTPA